MGDVLDAVIYLLSPNQIDKGKFSREFYDDPINNKVYSSIKEKGYDKNSFIRVTQDKYNTHRFTLRDGSQRLGAVQRLISTGELTAVFRIPCIVLPSSASDLGI